MNALTITKTLSIKVQTIATISALIAAVALPQIFHTLGAMSGLGTSLGETFLPMHLPIILVGLLAGGYAGAISGVFAPFISYALTGMPLAPMLPFMMIELCSYGLFAGLMRNVKLSSTFKVLTVQIIGRLIRAIAILMAVNVFSVSNINIATIWMSIPKGIFGIVLQLAFIPLMLYRIENLSKNE